MTEDFTAIYVAKKIGIFNWAVCGMRGTEEFTWADGLFVVMSCVRKRDVMVAEL